MSLITGARPFKNNSLKMFYETTYRCVSSLCFHEPVNNLQFCMGFLRLLIVPFFSKVKNDFLIFLKILCQFDSAKPSYCSESLTFLIMAGEGDRRCSCEACRVSGNYFSSRQTIESFTSTPKNS